MDTNSKGVQLRGKGAPTRGEGAIIRGPWTPNFTNLTADERVIRRGWALHQAGHVHPLPLYPGVYHITGGAHRTGVALYSVDLRDTPTCGCNYFQHRQAICKHIVAAIAYELERSN